MSSTQLNNEASNLRTVLYHIMHQAWDTRTVAEYRTRGKGAWKQLKLEAKLINLHKYEYRTATRNVWMNGRNITCSNGELSADLARRILKMLSKRTAFSVGGYDVRKYHDGRLSVGCTTFTKEDVAYARQLLAA